MHHMAELLDLHEMIYFHGLRLADPVNIITSQVYKHDVFCSVLLGIQEYCAKFFILCST